MEQNKKMFSPIEWVIFLVVVLCIVGIHGGDRLHHYLIIRLFRGFP